MRKGTMCSVAAAFITAALVTITAGTALAQKHTCAYVNDNNYGAPNAVDGYMVVGSSATYLNPVLTGGTSKGSGTLAQFVTQAILHPSKNILYASDSLSNDIAAMKINTDTCQLTLLGNYPTHGGAFLGIGLAISPNGKWFYATATKAQTLQLFNVRADGSLTGSRQTVDLPAGPAGMAVSLDGTTLIISFPRTAQIMSYAIDVSTGMLTQISTVTVGNEPQEIFVDAQSRFVYAGTNGGIDAEVVEQLELGPGSTLTKVQDRTWHLGKGSSALLLNFNGKYLYVSNGYSLSISTIRVNPSTGAMTFVGIISTGTMVSPPAGLAATGDGTLLFSGANTNGYELLMGIFQAEPDGSLVSLGTFPVGEYAGGAGNANPGSVVARQF